MPTLPLSGSKYQAGFFSRTGSARCIRLINIAAWATKRENRLLLDYFQSASISEETRCLLEIVALRLVVILHGLESRIASSPAWVSVEQQAIETVLRRLHPDEPLPCTRQFVEKRRAQYAPWLEVPDEKLRMSLIGAELRRNLGLSDELETVVGSEMAYLSASVMWRRIEASGWERVLGIRVDSPQRTKLRSASAPLYHWRRVWNVFRPLVEPNSKAGF